MTNLSKSRLKLQLARAELHVGNEKNNDQEVVYLNNTLKQLRFFAFINMFSGLDVNMYFHLITSKYR